MLLFNYSFYYTAKAMKESSNPCKRMTPASRRMVKGPAQTFGRMDSFASIRTLLSQEAVGVDGPLPPLFPGDMVTTGACFYAEARFRLRRGKSGRKAE